MANTKVTGDLIANGTVTATNLADGSVTAAKLNSITTDNITEGTNLFYTDARVGSYLSGSGYDTATNIIATITDSAPTTLDTLNELAAALGDDPNFATTVTNSIATKLPLAGGNITGNLSVDTNVLFVDTANDFVGIGTTSPATALDVSGRIRSLEFTADDGTVQTGFNSNSLIQISRGAAPSFLQFISPNNQQQAILFGDTDDTVSASLRYDHSGDYMWFEVNNAERMRIDGSGNVGIGISTPQAPLHVIAPNSANNSIIQEWSYTNDTEDQYSLMLKQTVTSRNVRYNFSMVNDDVAYDDTLVLSKGFVGIGITDPERKLHVADDASTYIQVERTTAGSEGNILLGCATTVNALYSRDSGSGDRDFAFITGSSERMRIDSSGNVGIGTVPVGTRAPLHIHKSSGATYIHMTNNDVGGTEDDGTSLIENTNGDFLLRNRENANILFYTNNIARMTISPSGNIGAPSGTNIYNASDKRLKQNITPIESGLNAISNLNPVKFNWIEGFVESEEGKNMLGFVAQEVQNVIPEAVEGFGGNNLTIGEQVIESPLRVNEKFIIPVLTKAIQELKEIIDNQQQQINDLKAQITK